MAALAKAGKEGKSLEPIKAKYNKYDESTAWKNKAQAVKESLDSMTTAGGTQEDLTKAAMGLATYAAKVDPKGFEAAMEAGDEAFTKYLQDMLAKGDVQPNPQAVQQAMDQVQGGGETSPEDQPKDMAGAGDIEAGEGVVTDFAAGAANQLGKEVGNVVRAGKTIAQNVSQFGSDVAGAAKAGYNQATGANNINSVKTGRQAPDPLQTPSAEPQTHNSAMAPKVGVPTGLRESSELDRMKEFLTRLNG